MKSDIITRMEANQARFPQREYHGRSISEEERDIQIQALQLEDRNKVGEYFDREMANRSDNGALDYLSEEQGEKELGEGRRQ